MNQACGDNAALPVELKLSSNMYYHMWIILCFASNMCSFGFSIVFLVGEGVELYKST